VETVTLVGAGIVNLVTALELVQDGFDVTVYDRAPDPRTGQHWTAYGCTRGGGDGRMFTLTEADSYNSRSWGEGGRSNNLLRTPVSEDGWLIAKPGSLSEAETAWARDFHNLPSRLAEAYNKDIFAVNRLADGRWAALIESEPGLFDANTGYADGILRLYTDADYFLRHVDRNNRVGATRRVLSATQVAADYPALAEPCAAGVIAGGIEVTGFTVNVHKFVARLVDLLEPSVRFHWNAEVARIRWAADGAADGLELASGETVRSRHYVLSPGAYGSKLLQGTAAGRQIQGMLGAWLTVPNTEPRLDHSLKIARPGHRAEETNVTLATGAGGQPVLVCGAGYGWTGSKPDNVDPAELTALFDGLEETLRQFFPQAYAAARAAGMLDEGRQVCVRPWTPTSLGVFERVPAADGGALIVTGGHNTGGFAQSPVVAEAVSAALGGDEHMMHSRYDPRRYDRDSADSALGSTSSRNT
jgi:glycine/D-amino acid oxidase-like deaminating enzyme